MGAIIDLLATQKRAKIPSSFEGRALYTQHNLCFDIDNERDLYTLGWLADRYLDAAIIRDNMQLIGEDDCFPQRYSIDAIVILLAFAKDNDAGLNMLANKDLRDQFIELYDKAQDLETDAHYTFREYEEDFADED